MQYAFFTGYVPTHPDELGSSSRPSKARPPGDHFLFRLAALFLALYAASSSDGDKALRDCWLATNFV